MRPNVRAIDGIGNSRREALIDSKHGRLGSGQAGTAKHMRKDEDGNCGWYGSAL